MSVRSRVVSSKGKPRLVFTTVTQSPKFLEGKKNGYYNAGKEEEILHWPMRLSPRCLHKGLLLGTRERQGRHSAWAQN